MWEIVRYSEELIDTMGTSMGSVEGP
jgi:hypothetical protein